MNSFICIDPYLWSGVNSVGKKARWWWCALMHGYILFDFRRLPKKYSAYTWWWASTLKPNNFFITDLEHTHAQHEKEKLNRHGDGIKNMHWIGMACSSSNHLDDDRKLWNIRISFNLYPWPGWYSTSNAKTIGFSLSIIQLIFWSHVRPNHSQIEDISHSDGV